MAELSLLELSQRIDSIEANQLGAANILAILKTVDGDGSGLDADLLDGKHYSDLQGTFLSLTGGTVTGDTTFSTKVVCSLIEASDILNLNASTEVKMEVPSGSGGFVSIKSDGSAYLQKGNSAGTLFIGNTTSSFQIDVSNTITLAGAGDININPTSALKVGGYKVPVLNNTTTPKDGDIQVSGSIINMYAGGSWKQIYPAVYN